MIPRTRIARAAAAALIAGMTGLMGACESDAFNERTSTAPLGAGSGSPTFLSTPSRQARTPERLEEEHGEGTGSPTVFEEEQPAPRRAAPMAGNCNYSPNAGAGMNVTGLAFPTGDPSSSALMVYQVMPTEVRRGADFGYEYHVTNLTRGTLQNVAVVLESRSNLEVISASPSASMGQGGAMWSLGDLGPCETRVIEVTARANDTGMASNCISASYNNALCATTNVVEPNLAIEKTVTPRVLRCDPITITYNVCNPGTGVAEGVVVRDTLPQGLSVNGSRNVEIQIGDLASGECREVSVDVMASTTGEFCSPAQANSADGLTASSGQPCTVVVAPDLEIVCNTRDTQYINRTATYEFVVSNNGDGVANNTVVNVTLPGTAEFQGSSAGGSPTAGGVTYNIGTLNPGESRTVSVDLVGRAPGSARVSANASAACAEPASTACETEFRGIPAILLEVVDLTDPVEVGTETTYVIRVTNQGSAPDTDVLVKCVLPDEMAYVAATGATPASVDGQLVTFGVERVLEPKEVVEWRLTVRAVGEGDVRFAVELTSAQFERPIRETESTNLYE